MQPGNRENIITDGPWIRAPGNYNNWRTRGDRDTAMGSSWEFWLGTITPLSGVMEQFVRIMNLL